MVFSRRFYIPTTLNYKRKLPVVTRLPQQQLRPSERDEKRKTVSLILSLAVATGAFDGAAAQDEMKATLDTRIANAAAAGKEALERSMTQLMNIRVDDLRPVCSLSPSVSLRR